MIRYPNITGTEAQQLAQVKRYLHQLADQLNFALQEAGGREAVPQTPPPSAPASQEQQAHSNFNAIKSLIIKSADIVESYYQQIDELLKLSGEYTASSAFGEYKEANDILVSANAQNIETLFHNTQSIQKDAQSTTILSTDAWLRVGKIDATDSGHYLYGLELGQTNEENGQQVRTKFACYTTEGTYLYDGNSPQPKVKITTDGVAFIPTVAFRSSYKMGGFRTAALPDGSVVRKWEGE